MSRSNGDVAIPWQTLISVVLLSFTVLGAGWTLFQNQFAYNDRDKDLIRAEIGRRESELKEAIKLINIELEQRRSIFVQQKEHMEFRQRLEDRLTALEEQNRFIRESRPTTSEITAVVTALKERIGEIDERQKLRPTRSEVDNLLRAHDTQMRDSMVALRREIDMFQKEVDRLLSMQLQGPSNKIMTPTR